MHEHLQNAVRAEDPLRAHISCPSRGPGRWMRTQRCSVTTVLLCSFSDRCLTVWHIHWDIHCLQHMGTQHDEGQPFKPRVNGSMVPTKDILMQISTFYPVDLTRKDGIKIFICASRSKKRNHSVVICLVNSLKGNKRKQKILLETHLPSQWSHLTQLIPSVPSITQMFATEYRHKL